MLKIAILTISDTRTKENDASGKAIHDLLTSGFEVCSYDIVKDEKNQIKDALVSYTDTIRADVVLTTGGTGLGPRDVTPEATGEIIERQVPGFSEYIRIRGLEKTPRSILSRGVSGIRKNTLIINLPGSPNAVKQILPPLLDIISHAIAMLHGGGHNESTQP